MKILPPSFTPSNYAVQYAASHLSRNGEKVSNLKNVTLRTECIAIQILVALSAVYHVVVAAGKLLTSAVTAGLDSRVKVPDSWKAGKLAREAGEHLSYAVDLFGYLFNTGTLLISPERGIEGYKALMGMAEKTEERIEEKIEEKVEVQAKPEIDPLEILHALKERLIDKANGNGSEIEIDDDSNSNADFED